MFLCSEILFPDMSISYMKSAMQVLQITFIPSIHRVKLKSPRCGDCYAPKSSQRQTPSNSCSTLPYFPIMSLLLETFFGQNISSPPSLRIILQFLTLSRPPTPSSASTQTHPHGPNNHSSKPPSPPTPSSETLFSPPISSSFETHQTGIRVQHTQKPSPASYPPYRSDDLIVHSHPISRALCVLGSSLCQSKGRRRRG